MQVKSYDRQKSEYRMGQTPLHVEDTERGFQFKLFRMIWTSACVKDMEGKIQLLLSWLWQRRIKKEEFFQPFLNWWIGCNSSKSQDGSCYSRLFVCDSIGSRNGSCYCRFRVLSSSNCSRLSWFCRILLSWSYEKVTKAAVFLKAFGYSTVSSEKSAFEMTVGIESFDFCTVILCCLGSRESKTKEMNCRPIKDPLPETRS